MNKRELECIAYEGACFTVEWYLDVRGKSQALGYYQSLPRAERILLLRLFKLIAEEGEIRDKTKFRHEGDKIFAFKPQPERFLCFFYKEGKIVVTNAFRKKQQKLPQREKDRALKAKESYLRRVKTGEYYE